MSELSDPFHQTITITVDTATNAITVHMVELTTFAAKTILEAVLDQLDDACANVTVAMFRNGQQVELPDMVEADADDE